MSRFRYTAPERLQFREGGGIFAVFGVPFLAAGIFLLLTALGIVPMNGDDDLDGWGRPLLGLMGVAFTAAGGGLVFGRGWTTLDVAERRAAKSWGLLVPFSEKARSLDEFARVTIGFDAGDSDASERFPVTLKARSGADFVVCIVMSYPEARACAAETARHLGFALDDASGGHVVALDPAAADRPLQQRARRDAHATAAPPPSSPRSEVHQETAGVRIVIPRPPLQRFALLSVAVPLAIPVIVAPWLWDFFQQTGTPTGIGVAFLSWLVFLFAVLPAISVVNGVLRARRGYTEILASKTGVTARERGAWRTRTVAALDADEILEVDFGTRDTGLAAARHAVEQKLLQTQQEMPPIGPRFERLMMSATRWAKGRGVIVKSRGGLTTFGQDLDDDEIRYLHSVVRRALVGRA